jgi:RNA polymerase sigma-70 factor (ECF subfamily)
MRSSVLRARLAKLSPRERQQIALKYFQALRKADIAEEIGLSESNAGTRLHRAMEKLREACDED